jgi:haloacetate dehalogenase
MTSLPELFPGFAEHRVRTDGAEIFARVGGSGPPLVLLHGYPQTHACWHRIAPDLAREFTVVAMDLRGYGQSSAPAGDTDHIVYSKRAMARDVVEVMRALGHHRFIAVGHDRGARVAYRLALDHPAAVKALAPLDILPTSEVWSGMRAESAIRSYHWAFLAQPKLMPETLIAGAHAHYLEHTLASWTRNRSLDCFSPDALAHYRASLASPARIHAVCEDYRAGATVDRRLDEEDMAAGRKIASPTFIVWGSDYIGKGSVDPLDIWRRWCVQVDGREITSGHFLAEENPTALLAALLPFLRGVNAGA